MIYLDPQANIDYASFYIEGLYGQFGKANVCFSGAYFKGESPATALRFVQSGGGVSTRFVIDWSDDVTISDEAYEWCDHYGKVNWSTTRTPARYGPKLTSLAPGFGLRIWNPLQSGWYALNNGLKARAYAGNIRRFLSGYLKQGRQVSLQQYKPGPAESDYIYSVNTLWNSDEWVDNNATVNQYRANFMTACRALSGIRFEGGFVYSQIKNEHPAFKPFLIDQVWIPKQTYLDRTKQSLLVFNTPAWAQCHGWKLGEYLALGKAIVSTPILNELPAPLEHGRHLHVVSGNVEEISQAIELIRRDVDYRTHLERNARAYYEQWASPTRAINLLIGQTAVRHSAPSTRPALV